MKEQFLDDHIIHIVQNHNISEQQRLQSLLKERGFNIPQASLSRRLKKIGVQKKEGIYTYNTLQTSNLPVVLNMKATDNGLLILHTNPGCASMLAYYLDKKYVSFHPDSNANSPMLGTIAGDDTVMIISKNYHELNKVMALLNTEFPYLGLGTDNNF